ncbi:MAG: TylF/MycF/NovP-related O-methyltransferase [Dehalococcoidia bacterium]
MAAAKNHPIPIRRRLRRAAKVGTGRVRTLIKQALARSGYQIIRLPTDSTLAAAWDGSLDRTIQPWGVDPCFRAIWEQIASRTMVDETRCFMLYQLARHVASLPGDAAEVGVYKGGTARLIALTLPATSVHLFDTFAGMPSVDPAKDPFSRTGDLDDATVEMVEQYLAGCDNTHIYPGLFPETAGAVARASFCFVHVDVVIYRSVLDCCRFFYDRLVPGGVLLFDDYGFELAAGARSAVDEFFADKPERPIYLPTGQCIVLRGSPPVPADTVPVQAREVAV